ncbi:MAG: hypothetical protein M3Y64_02410 [Gemmatimonadota bacterium]|nr:hypothetical protein [Gemmatimonadota bacterium]
MTTPAVIAADPLATLPPIVRWLMERSKPEPPALELVTPAVTFESLYALWMSKKQFASAIRLIASVLPARESIWWAWVSARHATQMPGGTAPTAAVHAALGNVERWITRPDDETRRATWQSANEAGLDTPIGMIGAAVFLSGVSIAPVNAAAVPPPPGAIVSLIPGAILLASASNSDARNIEPTQIAFAAQGLEVVKRLGGWDAALKTAHEAHVRAEQDYARATAAPAAR